jgi:predicted nuclease of predicted toxin-antitoxin system
MKIKIDENLGNSAKTLYLNNGFDVLSVYEQNISGISDNELFNLVCSENRCLITLDKDFSDVVRFNPKNSAGIVVSRIPGRLSIDLVNKTLMNFIEYTKKELPTNNTWIVEPNKIRIHQKE